MGTCRCLATLSSLAITSIRSSEKSFGCGLSNRIHFTLSHTAQTFSSRRGKLQPSYEYEFTFCPSSVISRTPLESRNLTSSRICSGERETSLPRTYGTMQYEQKLLHPFMIGTYDEKSPSL